MSIEPEPLPQDPIDDAAEDAAPEIDTSAERIAALEGEIARLKDHMLRALAETDNVRKRAVKEREDASKYAVSSFAKDMVEIADNFRRALDSIPEDVRKGDNALVVNLMAGIEAIERSLLKSFEKNGIKRLEPLGEMFNPNFHEVMFEAPMPGKPAGMVIQMVEPGYTLNDRLLRPARVGVAKGEAGETGGNTGPGGHLDESV